MFKKTKEKIDNNEYVSLFKKLWANKRYRSLLILFLYFIFFGIIIGAVRSNYRDMENNIEDNKQEDITVVERMTSWDNYNTNYQYNIIVNDEDKASVDVKDGIISLTVDNNGYTIINNNIYLNKNDDLKKVNKIDNLEISIPITKLNVKNIMDYLHDLKFDSYKDNHINYYTPGSYFVDNEKENILVEVIGDTNLEELVINYQEEVISLKMN